MSPGTAAFAPRARGASQAGYTLVELLVSVAIIGIAFTAIISGIWGYIADATQHRVQADTHLVLAKYAEAVGTMTYANCATTYTPAVAAFTLPTGYTSAVSVNLWNPATKQFDIVGAAGCTDPGAQRVQLTLTATNAAPYAYAATIDVVKRRDGP
jgi:prepilin-type N-terminal cleavage/methylation domain-containing protein